MRRLESDRLGEPYPLYEPFVRQCLVTAVEEVAAAIAAGYTEDDRKKVTKDVTTLMLSNLWRPGDRVTTPDGVTWSLTEGRP